MYAHNRFRTLHTLLSSCKLQFIDTRAISLLISFVVQQTLESRATCIERLNRGLRKGDRTKTRCPFLAQITNQQIADSYSGDQCTKSFPTKIHSIALAVAKGDQDFLEIGKSFVKRQVTNPDVVRNLSSRCMETLTTCILGIIFPNHIWLNCKSDIGHGRLLTLLQYMQTLMFLSKNHNLQLIDAPHY